MIISNKAEAIKKVRNVGWAKSNYRLFVYKLEKLFDMSLFDDEEFMLEYAKGPFARPLAFASERLKNDVNFCKKVMKIDIYNIECCSDNILDNEEFIKYFLTLENLTQNDLFKYVSSRLKENREIVLLAAEKCKIFPYISQKFLDDNEIVYKHLKYNKPDCSYDLISDRLKNDKDFVLSILKLGKDYSSIYIYLSENLKNDQDIINLCPNVSNNYNLKNAPQSIKSNREEVLKFIKKRGGDIIYASKNLRDDKELFDIAFKTGRFTEKEEIDYLVSKIKNNKELLLKYKDLVFIYFYLPKDLRNDFDVKKAVDYENAYISYNWYYGFYTATQKNQIKKSLNEHDYDLFMSIYNKNSKGLPNKGYLYDKTGEVILDFVDITDRDNFLKITETCCEAG